MKHVARPSRAIAKLPTLLTQGRALASAASRVLRVTTSMSALPPKADIRRRIEHVC
jgi:hypothetical protein